MTLYLFYLLWASRSSSLTLWLALLSCSIFYNSYDPLLLPSNWDSTFFKSSFLSFSIYSSSWLIFSIRTALSLFTPSASSFYTMLQLLFSSSLAIISSISFLSAVISLNFYSKTSNKNNDLPQSWGNKGGLLGWNNCSVILRPKGKNFLTGKRRNYSELPIFSSIPKNVYMGRQFTKLLGVSSEDSCSRWKERWETRIAWFRRLDSKFLEETIWNHSGVRN